MTEPVDVVDSSVPVDVLLVPDRREQLAKLERAVAALAALGYVDGEVAPARVLHEPPPLTCPPPW